jgi:osmoprotectant transport system substrate-binding protein
MNSSLATKHARFTKIGAVVVIATLALSACGGKSKSSSSSSTTPGGTSASTSASGSTSSSAADTSSSSAAAASESTSDSSSSGAAAADKSKKIVVGAANFGESEILANMYIGVLKKAGFTAEIKKGDLTRDLISKALLSGDISLTPEYVGTDTEYWNKAANGKDAPAKATTDAAATAAVLRELIAPKNLVAYEPSPAADQNAFAVTKATADKNGLKTMSDLSKVASTMTLGGPPECPTRPFCQVGLEKTYGLKFKAFKALDAGGPLTKNALSDGKIDIGLVFSSDGGIAARNFVVLEDDKHLQTADNVIPVLRKDIDSPELKAALDGLSAKLTTEALTALNKQVDIDKADAADVAQKWLADNGLA